MLLYHGTTETQLNQIRLTGLRPRGKRKSNYTKYPSRKDMVYLTNAYPFYFAVNISDEEPDIAAVLEIDTDQLNPANFYPDEDFITQALKEVDDEDFCKTHYSVRNNLLAYQQHWQLSLEGIGNCCYRGMIPLDAITRVCYFDSVKRPSFMMVCLDPTISIMNYSVCREKYQSLVSWMFGDSPTFTTVSEWEMAVLDDPDTAPGLRDDLKQQVEHCMEYWAKESQDRTGITVESWNAVSRNKKAS